MMGGVTPRKHYFRFGDSWYCYLLFKSGIDGSSLSRKGITGHGICVNTEISSTMRPAWNQHPEAPIGSTEATVEARPMTTQRNFKTGTVKWVQTAQRIDGSKNCWLEIFGQSHDLPDERRDELWRVGIPFDPTVSHIHSPSVTLAGRFPARHRLQGCLLVGSLAKRISCDQRVDCHRDAAHRDEASSANLCWQHRIAPQNEEVWEARI